jgi:hypothetical protein
MKLVAIVLIGITLLNSGILTACAVHYRRTHVRHGRHRNQVWSRRIQHETREGGVIHERDAAHH